MILIISGDYFFIQATRRAKLRKAAFISSLDGRGGIPHSKEDFVNEMEVGLIPKSETHEEDIEDDEDEIVLDEDGNVLPNQGPHIVYEVSSEDGAFSAESADVTEIWTKVFAAVQEARSTHSMTPLPSNPLGQTGLQMLGLTHSALAFLLEQMPGAKQVERYETNQFVGI